MREKQLIIMPLDSKYQSRNMTWSQVLEWANVDDNELKKIIDDGIEVKGCYVDEVLIYDSKL
jgi:hypothetical protein